MLPNRPGLCEEAERFVERHSLRRHRLEERCRLRLGLRVGVAFPQLDVGPEASGFGEHGQAGLRILAECSVVGWSFEQLGGSLHCEFVEREVLRDRCPLFAVHEVWPVLATPCHDRYTVGGIADGERVDLPRIDRFEGIDRDESFQPGMVAASRVEALEVGSHLLFTAGDLVEILLHESGEVVVDVVAEVLLEKTDNSEGLERRGQSGAVFANVATILDRRDDRRVRRGSADPELFEPLDEAGLGVAGRWLRLVNRRAH